MPKKTIKAKRNKVLYKNKNTKKKTVKKRVKKKRVVKKKVNKKKSVKKKVSKTKVVKKKKRKRKKRISMEDIYGIINKIQLNRKKAVFATDETLAPTIENIIRDQELKYNKVEMKTQVIFTIYPNEEQFDDRLNEDLMEIDFLEDEIVDPDQIFP